MVDQAAQVLADRAARDAAKVRLDDHYQALKADLQQRGLSGRMADEAMERAKLMFDEGVTLVEENPAVIGGTLAALVLWLLRNPIIDTGRDIYDAVRDRLQ